MSESSDTFEESIQDAENLLKHFNALNTKPPAPELEVLKRAGLIMAMTAWETYVEDRVLEEASKRLSNIEDRGVATFVKGKLEEEIKRLHNPDYQKTVQLFSDYAGVDLKSSWSWNNHEPKTVRDKLNRYIRLRGDVVHRSRKTSPGSPEPHPVKKVDLEKAISFLRRLVVATESALD